MRKVSAALIASIIAYPLSDAGFTESERMQIARVFAAELHIRQTERFLDLCKRETEKVS